MPAMTGRRQQITLQPEVLRWARERAGLSQEALAKKFPINVDRVTGWEETGKISIAQADKLAAKTYTPLGYLYLSEPPDESLPIRDFRTRDDGPAQSVQAPDLLDTVYQMQRRQSLDARQPDRRAKKTRFRIYRRLQPERQTYQSRRWRCAQRLNLRMDGLRRGPVGFTPSVFCVTDWMRSA